MQFSCHVLDPTSHYIALTHIRSAIVVGGFWCCCLRRRVLTFREAVVVWFGGLRVSERPSLPSLVVVRRPIHFFVCAFRDQGAVGLAMLLILNNDDKINKKYDLELKLVCPCKKVDMFGSV